MSLPIADPNFLSNFGKEMTKEMEMEMEKKKVVVIMGATGAGKSKLAIDLASRFSGVEIVNADSMQVYHGLDVLTNKVPLSQRNGIPHHLLGTIDTSVEFTSKEFRDLAIPIIEEILSRNGLPVIVGGTNYYIQALVSPFLFDDMHEDLQECSVSCTVDESEYENGYERLKEIDPVSANRLHPNDLRKINRYLNLYEKSGVVPSELFQSEDSQKWGRSCNFRYNCCFIWIDATVNVLDKYIDERVNEMIGTGLLNELAGMYQPNAVYTKGLMQAIGVREFDGFFRNYLCKKEIDRDYSENIAIGEDEMEKLLDESIDKMKHNTRKLVRKQRRRLARLKDYFGWNLHYIDSTEAFFCSNEDIWKSRVIEPCVEIVSNFLSDNLSSLNADQKESLISKNLWAQYVCEVCGNKVLRGEHEWEQHIQGRTHRKRVYSLKMKQ